MWEAEAIVPYGSSSPLDCVKKELILKLTAIDLFHFQDNDLSNQPEKGE